MVDADIAQLMRQIQAPLQILLVLRRFQVNTRRRNPRKMNAHIRLKPFDIFPRRLGERAFEPRHFFARRQIGGWRFAPAG